MRETATDKGLAEVDLAGDEVLEELAVEVDRLRHVARIHVLAVVDLPRRRPGPLCPAGSRPR
jgi:hypothetical protein